MNKLRKLFILVTALIVVFVMSGNSMKISAATKTKDFKDLTPEDIKLGGEFISNQYMSGIMGTRQVVKLSSEKANSFVYRVGGLSTEYYDTKVINSMSFETTKGYINNETTTTQVQVSYLMEDLMKVGANVKLYDNVIADFSQSRKTQTEVTGSCTNMFSSTYSYNEKVTIELKADTIDTTKTNVAFGYVVEYVRFTIAESYEQENRIFVGWTTQEHTKKKDYYAYIFTRTYKTWIYNNGDFFGTVGNIQKTSKNA